MSVTEVALEEEAIESVSSFAVCFLLNNVEVGGKARLGIVDNADVFELSFEGLVFDLSFFFLLYKILLIFDIYAKRNKNIMQLNSILKKIYG